MRNSPPDFRTRAISLRFSGLTNRREAWQSICLEIGFGNGEHLAGQALANPDTGFIGAEVFKNGVANLLSLITGIKKADELKARAVDVRDGQDLGVVIRALVDDLHLKFFYDVLYADGAIGIHSSLHAGLGPRDKIHFNYNRCPPFLQAKTPCRATLFSHLCREQKNYRFFHLF